MPAVVGLHERFTEHVPLTLRLGRPSQVPPVIETPAPLAATEVTVTGHGRLFFTVTDVVDAALST